MKHLFELDSASAEKITPSQMVLAYGYGYQNGAMMLLAEYRKVQTYTEAATDSLTQAAARMMLSQRALRLKSSLDFHDLRKVPDAADRLVLESMKTYSVSVGVCIGAFVMNSLMIASMMGKNSVLCPLEIYRLFLKKIMPQRDRIRESSIDYICNAAPKIGNVKDDLFLTTMRIMSGDSDTGKECDDAIKAVDARISVYLNSETGEQLYCHADEDLEGHGRKLPMITEMKLPKPTMEGISPADPIEKEAWWNIIEKNPGYGLSFWELMRELGKQHGAYFVPSFGLSDEFLATRSKEECRSIIDHLDERSWE